MQHVHNRNGLYTYRAARAERKRRMQIRLEILEQNPEIGLGMLNRVVDARHAAEVRERQAQYRAAHKPARKHKNRKPSNLTTKALAGLNKIKL